MKLFGIISVDFNITDKLLIRSFVLFGFWRKKWKCNKTAHQLFIDFKKAYDSLRREVLDSILIEFGVPMKLIRLIKMCLNEMYSKVHIGKYLPENFSIQNGLDQGYALLPLLLNIVLKYATRKVQ
jgi:hypothetical protein